MSARIREQLALALAWLDDPNESIELRCFARDQAAAALHHLHDERAMTDALAVLHRAVDRGDLIPLDLLHELPSVLDDGRVAETSAFVPLGNRALAHGEIEALIKIASVALDTASAQVPAEWVVAILEAETGEPQTAVLDVTTAWLMQADDPAPVHEVLRRRPLVLESLRHPPEALL